MAHLPSRLSIPSRPSLLNYHKDDSPERHWDDLIAFYWQNQSSIEKFRLWDLENSTSNERAKYIENTMENILETTEVVLECLCTLSKVHPVVGAAVYAFQHIVKLDMARRDITKKSLPIMIQMHTMMCTMFELRSIRVQNHEKTRTISDRKDLQVLMQIIAQDITKCGSDLKYYTDRPLLAKIASANKYEKRFKEHMETFSTHRAELQGLLTAYIANGLDAANEGIQSIQYELISFKKDMHAHIDAVFQKTMTQREKVILRIMKANGGPEKCFQKDELLSKLVQISGESTDINAKVKDLQKIREALLSELRDNLEEALDRHTKRFEKLLNIQDNNIERIFANLEEMSKEQKLIKKAVITNIKLEDEDLQSIWSRMSLKRSVKAKHFVLTLRDHILPDRSRADSTETSPAPGITTLDPDLRVVLSPAPRSGILPQGSADPDSEWVFELLDVTHVQPIAEAMDIDQSGFISVKEANMFASSRPQGLSLLRWIAYWASGWHINITNYRNKIHSIVIELYELGSSTLPVNRLYVAEYLNHPSFLHIEGLLRSTKPLPDDARKDPKLNDIAQSMAAMQEHILLKNLEEVFFIIESPSDAALIAGRIARVETWIYPLLYLVLNRHLAILKIAKRRILHEDEMNIHFTTLKGIFHVFDERMRKLAAIFRQKYRDVEAQFENHAYGMFLTTFKGTEIDNHKNSLVTLNFVPNSSDESDASTTTKPGPIDTSILCKGLGPDLEYEDFDGEAFVAPQTSHNMLLGDWIGVCLIPDHSSSSYPANSSLRLRIESIDGNALKGKGEGLFGLFDLKGQCVLPDDDISAITVCFSISVQQNGIQKTILKCNGIFNPETATISGQCTSVVSGDAVMEIDGKVVGNNWTEQETEQEYWCPKGSFIFSKDSPDIFRLRHILNGPWVSSSWNPARRRWAFAIASIMVDVQRRMGSCRLFQSRLSERKKWIELTIRGILDSSYNLSPNARRYLSDQQEEDLRQLTRSTPPENARLYKKLANYMFSRKIFNMGKVLCDICGLRITFTRFLCITCMEEDMSNQLDLCAECIGGGSLSGQRKFIHQHSHTLIRCSRPLNYYEIPSIISMARLKSQRIQSSFLAADPRELETKDTKQKVFEGRIQKELITENPVLVKSPAPVIDLVCYVCEKTVRLPCWACTTCDILICLDCEIKGEYPRSKHGVKCTHLSKHLLLRINSGVESKTTRKEDKANQLGEQLRASLETGIKQGLTALEDKMNRSIDALKSDIKHVSQAVVDNAEELSVPSSAEHSTDVKATNQTQNDKNLEARLAVLETRMDSIIQMMQEVLITSRKEISE